ncbi:MULTISPECIES: DUF1775 domain-containing protein [unclassified Brucella]|uniref:DUF1775 domain-containing protein n=1 Tax=unclassified Brucella TaxID=2632610 RepID=UPI00217ED4C0|nr:MULTISPECIES: DUF1775 domain-containing protein [unclassified Brucella]UWF66633.1 DUF1775 domain-containing protein [Brucella sp. 1315]UWF69757.1 DUF1775 domain-containing protein [Brucella sp. 2594]
MKNHRLFASAISVFALCASAGIASAHCSLDQKEAKAGTFYKAALRIPHGCEGKATTKVTVDLPEGFIMAQPQAKAGWKIETTKGDYAHGYKLHGKEVTSGVKQISWSDGNLPSDFYDEFVVVGQLAPFDKDTTLSFPVTQFCGDAASVAWTEIAKDGQNPHDLKHPAPQLRVLAAASTDEHAGHDAMSEHMNHAAMPTKVGDLVITSPSVRAMVPGAKVAGGFLTIANDGKKADKLVSVSAPGVKRVEIHEMTMQDQIMKMRKLEGGLDLPAGKTMQLKSGGYHLMFIEPEHPYEEGETVPVTLEFKKAGKVEINFPVTAKKGQTKDHSEHSSH